MYEKSKKLSLRKYLLFGGIFLSGIGGYPSPTLNGKSSDQKSEGEWGGTQ